MIFLLNKERVVSEMVLLAKYRLAEKFKMSPDKIDASFEVLDGKLVPNFVVPVEKKALPIEKKFVSEGIAEIWLENIKPELEFRLQNIDQSRFKMLERVEDAKEESTTQETNDKTEAKGEVKGESSENESEGGGDQGANTDNGEDES